MDPPFDEWLIEKPKRKRKKPAPRKPEQWREELVRGLVECVEKVEAEQAADQTPKPKPETQRGAPCAKSWDDAWIATVEAAEERLDRRICGARTPAGNPCELKAGHDNGRCRFHGGFPLTGAPQGNRNAVIHGLYSRRLKVCDARCPLWDQCPCAGPDVQATPAPDRPICPYEQTEYNTALTDALARVATKPQPDPLDRHLAHNLALLQVMLNRAAIALRNDPLVDEVTASSDSYKMASRKPGAHLEAFLRITAEYRRFAALLTPRDPVEPMPEDALHHHWTTAIDTQLDPDPSAEMHREPFHINYQANRYIRQAIHHAAAGRDVAMLDAFEAAHTIAPAYTALAESKVLAAYRPTGDTLPEPAVETILEYINQRAP